MPKITYNPVDVQGWVLVAKEDDSPRWYIAWMDIFGTKKAALKFATDNNWPKPFKAMRGRIRADQ